MLLAISTRSLRLHGRRPRGPNKLS